MTSEPCRLLPHLLLPARGLPGGACALVAALALGLSCQVTALAGAEDSVASLPLVELNQLFANKDYAGIEALCRKLRVDHPTNNEVDYELACALARQGHPEDAVANLATACTHGFSDVSRANGDDDLASLHGRPDFTQVIQAMGEKPIGQNEAYEAGDAIAGLTTIEHQPLHGLRYRLRLGAQATAQQPARLVVWMHPSGGSMNVQVEALAGELAHHGFALVVFTQKQFLYWSDQESAAILPTLTDLATVPGVDASAPILMGFSAGGQAALQLWKAHPAAFGGLMLDAAYPLDVDGSQHASPIQLTAADLAAKTPMLAIIGSEDPNLHFWNTVIPDWSTQGTLVSLITVPGAHHQFLYSGDAWTQALAWLDHRQGHHAEKAAP
jgi:predicted esterase